MQNTFDKSYKLCSKVQISKLFNKGKRISSGGITIIFLNDKRTFENPFQVMISVPKKKYNKAVERNHIKRLCREGIRKNKLILESHLLNKQKKIAFVLNYTSNELPNHEVIDTKIKLLFQKLINHV